MSFSLKIEGLEDIIDGVKNGQTIMRSEIKRAMSNSVQTVKNTAQRIVAYKTGTLRRSIYTEVSGDSLHGIVGQDSNVARYGSYIEFGTRPHIIYPVNGKALFWKGASHPMRSVKHPGTIAKPFMQPALEQNVNKIVQFFENAVVNIGKGWVGK